LGNLIGAMVTKAITDSFSRSREDTELLVDGSSIGYNNNNQWPDYLKKTFNRWRHRSKKIYNYKHGLLIL